MKKFLLLLTGLFFIATVNAQIKNKTNIKDTPVVNKSAENLRASARRTTVKDAHDKYANQDSAAYLKIKATYKPPGKATKKELPK